MSKELHYDLVVVGGGPAGSSSAWAAAKKGIKVALIEKEGSIAETVRTSGVTWIQNINEFGYRELYAIFWLLSITFSRFCRR